MNGQCGENVKCKRNVCGAKKECLYDRIEWRAVVDLWMHKWRLEKQEGCLWSKGKMLVHDRIEGRAVVNTLMEMHPWQEFLSHFVCVNGKPFLLSISDAEITDHVAILTLTQSGKVMISPFFQKAERHICETCRFVNIDALSQLTFFLKGSWEYKYVDVLASSFLTI